MKHWLTILLLLTTTLAFAEKRALVIGIGAYPDVDYGWPTIHGDNDIAITKATLLCNGFKVSNIDTLRNEDATYQAICKAFQKLISIVRTNDIVYIHFSGHGQQITDLDGDEPDGYDEAWILYDALQELTPNYHGEHHITDDQLNTWLHQIREKVGVNGRIIVVSDACHSGSATRDLSEPTEIRGSHAVFPIEGIKRPYKQKRSIDWICISACADDECNRQYQKPNGEQCGSLTYALYQMRNYLSSLSISELTNLLPAKIKELVSRTQTPQIECPAETSKQTLFK